MGGTRGRTGRGEKSFPSCANNFPFRQWHNFRNRPMEESGWHSDLFLLWWWFCWTIELVFYGWLSLVWNDGIWALDSWWVEREGRGGVRVWGFAWISLSAVFSGIFAEEYGNRAGCGWILRCFFKSRGGDGEGRLGGVVSPFLYLVSFFFSERGFRKSSRCSMMRLEKFVAGWCFSWEFSLPDEDFWKFSLPDDDPESSRCRMRLFESSRCRMRLLEVLVAGWGFFESSPCRAKTDLIISAIDLLDRWGIDFTVEESFLFPWFVSQRGWGDWGVF